MKRELELPSDMVRIIREYFKQLYANICDNFQENGHVSKKIKLTKPSSRKSRKYE